MFFFKKSNQICSGLEIDLYGFTIIIKNDNTIYTFDMNCIYELKRVGYTESYDESKAPQYKERW